MYKTVVFLVGIVFFLTVLELVLREDASDVNFMNYRYTNRLRGIAAILVVISHVSGLTGTRVATPLGGIGVAIFLVCSGYGMYEAYIKRGMKGFWRRKVKRVLLPYWITVILYYVVNFNQYTFNVEGIVKNILLINPVPYLWFVQYLMIFNVIFWLVFSFGPEKIRIPIFLAVGIIILLFIENDMYAEQGFSFVVGLMLARFYNTNEIEKNKVFKVGCIFLIVSITFLGIKQFPEIRNCTYIIMNIIQMFIKLLGACGILLITWKTGAVWNKAFISIGKYSYELYIVHTLLIPYLVNHRITIMAMLIYLVSCGGGVIILHWMLQKIDVIKNRVI